MQNKRYKFEMFGKWWDIEQVSLMWHDERSSSKVWRAVCEIRGKKAFYLYDKDIKSLIKELKSMNINVVEVCDKLRWKHQKEQKNTVENWTFKYLTEDNVIVKYFIRKLSGNFIYEIPSSNCRKININHVKTIAEAKNACQADFKKRKVRK